MTGSILMIIGFVVGAAVASVIFALVGAGRRKKLKVEASERAEAQDSISALFADADAIEANFRVGALAPDSFRLGLSEKVNAATRLLRTRMHGMDVFFVKYVEMQLQEYMRVLENPERRKVELAAFAQAAPEPAAPSFGIAPAPLASVGSLVGEPDYGFELPAGAPPSAPAPIREAEPVPGGFDSGDVFAAPPPPPPSAPLFEEEPIPEPEFAPAAPEPEPVPEFMQTPPPAAPEPVREPLPAGGPVITEPVLGGPVLGEPVLGEPILGEPDNAEFDLSAIAPAPAAPPPPPPPARGPAPAGDAWTDQSIEEFEAAFAQFEDEPVTFEESSETGSFPAVDGAPAPEAPRPHGAGDEHMLTETSSIDRGAIANALAAQQSPQPPQSVHKQASAQPPGEAKEQQPDQQGITGDDVVDVIDSFFNLK